MAGISETERENSGGGSLKPHQGLISGVLGHRTLGLGVMPGMIGDALENDSGDSCRANKLGEESWNKPGDDGWLCDRSLSVPWVNGFQEPSPALGKCGVVPKKAGGPPRNGDEDEEGFEQDLEIGLCVPGAREAL